MKKRIIVGFLGVGVIAGLAALYQTEVGAVSCVSPYSHRTYLLSGVEKHCCVRTTTGSLIKDWGFWGIGKNALRGNGALDLKVQLFGTVHPADPEGPICEPLDETCVIPGLQFCCNKGGGCGGQGTPFFSDPVSAFAVLSPGDCDSTGKCRDIITVDLEEEQLECQNRNWGGTFTPSQVYVQSCTCDTEFDVNGDCTVEPSCTVELCSVDLTGYQPGDQRDYSCQLISG